MWWNQCGVLLCLFIYYQVARSANVLKSRADVIGFPEEEEDERLRNKENRQPVFIPSMCGQNELFYPGDQADDWICDCRPAHLYHPESDKCWPAYRRGPCQIGFYLILPQNSVIPLCERNPCHSDGYVYWLKTNKCDQLGSSKPCEGIYPAAAMGVNATTLAIGCVQLSLETRFGGEESKKQSSFLCSPGTKQSVQGKCIVTVQKTLHVKN